ncbi:MAG: metallophosphoesterase family protein [Chloroflexota bacterium]
MKVLIISDIHSNIYALEAIWAKENDCDLVLCAGDLVDWGPYPNEVIAWIQAHKVPTVQGNHDAWAALYYRRGKSLPNPTSEERGWIHYTATQLSEEEVLFLEGLPQTLTFSIDDIDYGMTHLIQGQAELVSRYGFEQFRQEQFGDATFSRLIIGHTHFQGVRQLSNEWLWLNPGSVSYRRRGDPDKMAHYIVLENGRISLNRLAYDRRKLYAAAKTIPLGPSEHAAVESIFGL